MKTTMVNEEELELLITDLIRYLSEVIVMPFTTTTTVPDITPAAPTTVSNPMQQKAPPQRGRHEIDSDDEEDYRSSSIVHPNGGVEGIEMRESTKSVRTQVITVSRKECEAYINAKQLTIRMIYVSLDL